MSIQDLDKTDLKKVLKHYNTSIKKEVLKLSGSKKVLLERVLKEYKHNISQDKKSIMFIHKKKKPIPTYTLNLKGTTKRKEEDTEDKRVLEVKRKKVLERKKKKEQKDAEKLKKIKQEERIKVLKALSALKKIRAKTKDKKKLAVIRKKEKKIQTEAKKKDLKINIKMNIIKPTKPAKKEPVKKEPAKKEPVKKEPAKKESVKGDLPIEILGSDGALFGGQVYTLESYGKDKQDIDLRIRTRRGEVMLEGFGNTGGAISENETSIKFNEDKWREGAKVLKQMLKQLVRDKRIKTSWKLIAPLNARDWGQDYDMLIDNNAPASLKKKLDAGDDAKLNLKEAKYLFKTYTNAYKYLGLKATPSLNVLTKNKQNWNTYSKRFGYSGGTIGKYIK